MKTNDKLLKAAQNVWDQFHDEADLYFTNEFCAAMLVLKFSLDSIRAEKKRKP